MTNNNDPCPDTIRQACSARVAELNLHARLVAEMAGIGNVQHVVEFLAGRSSMTTRKASRILEALGADSTQPLNWNPNPLRTL